VRVEKKLSPPCRRETLDVLEGPSESTKEKAQDRSRAKLHRDDAPMRASSRIHPLFAGRFKCAGCIKLVTNQAAHSKESPDDGSPRDLWELEGGYGHPIAETIAAD